MSQRVHKVVKKVTIQSKSHKSMAFGIVGLCLAIGITTILLSHAATPTAATEAEAGTRSGCATVISDSNASGGQAVRFGTAACGSGSAPYANAGAHLPISYSLGSLTGTVLYVATNGSDAGSGSVSSPYATLSKAISAIPSGGTIVLRGGTYYNQGNLSVGKTITITAYPGETPVFDGASLVSSGWSVSGSLSSIAYTPMPVTDGSGITFTACQNQTASCMGKYPDQAWAGGQQLRQVASQAAVVSGTFWVDSANSRLYMMTTDVNKGSVAVSNLRKFISLSAPHITLRGFKVIRYSNTASDYGVINLDGNADYALMDNIYMSDTSFIAVQAGPSGTNLNTNSTIQNSTIQNSNWMGVGALATDYFTLNNDDIGNMNQFGEFTSSPQSGSLKTSRTWYTKVLNSKITGNKTVAIWFDQSNYDVTVAGNDIENNTGAGLFFEISDFLYAVNNYFRNNGATSIEVSGSSHAYIVNNTVVGGSQQMGVYTDSRSIPGCSDPAHALCSGSYSSDRDTYHTHLATMTWIPSVDLAINNIFAYPSGSLYCGANIPFCITGSNASATVALNDILHHADPANNIPQTLVDGNVYANGTGQLITTPIGAYSTLPAFTSAMAGAPVNIGGFEVHGYSSNQYVNTNGSTTSALQSLFGNAVAVPADANINPYLPVGTRHYGVTWQ